MKRKHDQIDAPPELPNEILFLILSFVPFERGNWLNCRLVSKKFLALSKEAQDPSIKDNLAIRRAFKEDRYDVIRELLKDKRVDPSVDPDFLYSAIIFDQVDVVKELISRPGIDPSRYENTNGDSPLWLAMHRGSIQAALELVKDSRVSLWCHEIDHALEYAVVVGYWQLIKPILERPDMKESDVGSYYRLLKKATKVNKWLSIRALLTYANIDLSADRSEVLFITAQKGYTEAFRELVKHPKIRCSDFVLRVAIRGGHLEIAKTIFERGINLGDEKWDELPSFLLAEAVASGNLEMVRYLLPKVNKGDVAYSRTWQHHLGIAKQRTGEIETAILDYAEIFEEYASKIAIKACAVGSIETAKFLMKNPRFKASPSEMEYLRQSLEEIENTKK